MKNKTVKEKKDGRGGKREGAGRKKQDKKDKKTVTLSFRIDESDIRKLRPLYRKKGDIAKICRKIIKNWIDNELKNYNNMETDKKNKFWTTHNEVIQMVNEKYTNQYENFIANLCANIEVEIAFLDGKERSGNADDILSRIETYIGKYNGNTFRNLVTEAANRTKDWYEHCLRYAIGFVLEEGSNDMSYLIEAAGALARSTEFDIWTFNEWQDDMNEKHIEKYVVAIWAQVGNVTATYKYYDEIIQEERGKNENLLEYDEDYVSYKDDIDAWSSYIETASTELSFTIGDIYSEIDAVMQAFVNDNKDELFKKDSELPF